LITDQNEVTMELDLPEKAKKDALAEAMEAVTGDQDEERSVKVTNKIGKFSMKR